MVVEQLVKAGEAVGAREAVEQRHHVDWRETVAV
jgi:hypothetical protein